MNQVGLLPLHIKNFGSLMAAELQVGMVTSTPTRPGRPETCWLELVAAAPTTDHLSIRTEWRLTNDLDGKITVTTYLSDETLTIGY